jgi:threonine/homoserine/homoserine lactone efflux protein
MPRVLCLAGLVVSGLVFLLFLVNMIMTLTGAGSLFQFPSLLMDILFIASSAMLGYLSWSALREIK